MKIFHEAVKISDKIEIEIEGDFTEKKVRKKMG